MGIITNYFRVGDTASTPLVRGAELIPVAYTLRYIPFKEITKINSNQNDYNDRNDSLQDRKENPKDYILTKDDKLINELLR